MKMKALIALFSVTSLFTSACSFHNREDELVMGKHVMQEAEVQDLAWVLLEDENKF